MTSSLLLAWHRLLHAVVDLSLSLWLPQERGEEGDGKVIKVDFTKARARR